MLLKMFYVLLFIVLSVIVNVIKVIKYWFQNSSKV